ncbi:hypothetical protein LCI18_009454 [Fusarium solani-melongenae]|uniref:Uncharacterized protein n=1 Tax=Fusarium solani subsp. cucurbitae TaxID=2747967 RepID=A0ACD3ZB74_FUSSC|nr:hypothetical protein LCI18_009454 [Fusarium solani-melongenae]
MGRRTAAFENRVPSKRRASPILAVSKKRRNFTADSNETIRHKEKSATGSLEGPAEPNPVTPPPIDVTTLAEIVKCLTIKVAIQGSRIERLEKEKAAATTLNDISECIDDMGRKIKGAKTQLDRHESHCENTFNELRSTDSRISRMFDRFKTSSMKGFKVVFGEIDALQRETTDSSSRHGSTPMHETIESDEAEGEMASEGYEASSESSNEG